MVERIEKLNKQNYDTWSLIMRRALRSKKLWVLIENNIFDKGTDVNNEEVKAHMANPDIKKQLEAVEDEVNNDTAMTMMYAAMENAEIRKTGLCDTAAELWEKIRENHLGSGTDLKNITLSEFLGFSYRKSESITSYCGRFETTLGNAEASGALLDESTKLYVFRNSLPAHMKTAANYWLMANPNGKVQNLITNVKLQFGSDKAENGETVAYYCGSTSDDSSKKFCKYCKRRNHDISECRKKAAKEQAKEQAKTQAKDQDKPKDQTKSKMNNPGKPKGQKYAYNMVERATTKGANDWVVDSGASSHMTYLRRHLTNYEDLEEPRIIILGDGKETLAVGKGELEFESSDSEGVLTNVLFVPDLKENLFSVTKAMSKGISVDFSGNSVSVMKNETVTMTATKNGDNLFILTLKPLNVIHEHASVSVEEWHRRFGHSSIDLIKQAAKQDAVIGLKFDSLNEVNDCENCAAGKLTRSSHPSRRNLKASENSAIMHVDTCGPFSAESLGGSKYYVAGVDEYSNYKLIRFVANKHEIADVVKQMISQLEAESKRTLKVLVTDNGSEFVNSNLSEFLKVRGIVHDRSTRYTPEQNGCVERANRTIIDGIRTLLSDARLPVSLWAEAAGTVVYTTNRLIGPRSSTKTRHELYWGHKPDIRNLRVFGQTAFVRVQNSRIENKFMEKAIKMTFVGYTDRFNTYRFYDPESGAVDISCDVRFGDFKRAEETDPAPNNAPTYFNFNLDKAKDKLNDHEIYDQDGLNSAADVPLDSQSRAESVDPNLELDGNGEIFELPSPDNKSNDVVESQISILNSLNDEEKGSLDENDSTPTILDALNENEGAVSTRDNSEISSFNDSADSNKFNGVSSSQSDIAVSSQPNPAPARSLRSNTTTAQLVKPANILSWFWAEHADLASVTADEPRNVQEARDSGNWSSWREAMDDEMSALHKNKTWILVPRPKNRRVIKCRWVFKLKTNPDGSIERFRARLVAKGFSQVPDIDFKATFAPVASSNTIRLVFAFAAKFNMNISQFDVKTAFLYGDLEETLFMEFPEGYDNPEKKVCKLIKNLYGLKQAPRNWNRKFHDLMEQFKLKRSNFDRCLYFNDNCSLILAIYVDDGLLLSNDTHLQKQFMAHLKSNFETKFIPCSSYLGFQIEKQMGSSDIFLHQTSYCNKILQKFGMADCKAASTPEEVGQPSYNDETPLTSDYPFKDVVGSLLYLVTCTRPDIAHAVSMASRTGKPTMIHWQRLKRILRYLKGTTNFGIRFRGGQESPELVGYSDADYANDPITRRSTSGYCILYAGGPLAWKCQQQPIVSLSTTEAEFISGCDLVKDLVPIRETLIELGAIRNESTPVMIDNLSTVRISNDEGGQKRTKHIDVRYKWLNEQSEKKIIKVQHINGVDQAADILTKPLHKTKFQTNRSLLMTSLTLLACLAIVDCKQLLRIDPIEFVPTKHQLLNIAMEWPMKFIYPNICHIANVTLKNELSKPSFENCLLRLNKTLWDLKNCQGPNMDFQMRTIPHVVLQEGQVKPFLAIINARKDLKVLLEPVSGAYQRDEKIEDDKFSQSLRTITETKEEFQTEMQKYTNQTQMWDEYVNPLLDEFEISVLKFNNLLKSGTLSVASKIWNNQSVNNGFEASTSKQFNCTHWLSKDGLEIDLHFITTAKSDPSIEFFEANHFNFYNATVDEYNRSTTCWMVYHGPKAIMINSTNSCMVEVDLKTLSSSSTEVQLCENKSENLKLFATRMWHKEYCTTNIIPQKDKIQIRYLEGIAKIYCFPFNITIDDELVPCPDHVFEINTNSVTRIAGMEMRGSGNSPKLDSTQTHSVKSINSILKTDEIKVSVSKFFNDVGDKVSDAKNSMTTYFKDVPQKFSNITDSISNTISNGAKTVTNKLTGGLVDAFDTIWSYIKWAGIVISVLVGVILLFLAAPIFEIIFIGLKLFRIPYMKVTGIMSRTLFKWNKRTASRTIEKTNLLFEKAKQKLVFQHKKLSHGQKMAKIV